MFFWDSTIIILIPAILLTIYAQFKISSTYSKYSQVRSERGYTGAQTARMILDRNGLHDVQVEMTHGRLSDHYDPRGKVVRLSEDVYRGTSLASVAVAAHETGHAVQDDKEYYPMRLRASLVPVANFGSQLGPILIFVALLMPKLDWLLQIGIVAFAAAVLFQVVTLPVEFNASNRAMSLLESEGVLGRDEVGGARKVLSAAALTYVAAALVAVLELVRLLLIARDRE